MQWVRQNILLGIYPLPMRIESLYTACLKLIIFYFILNGFIWNIETVMGIDIWISGAGIMIRKWFFVIVGLLSLFLISKGNLLFGFVFVGIFAVDVIFLAFFLFMGKFRIFRIGWFVLRLIINIEVGQNMLSSSGQISSFTCIWWYLEIVDFRFEWV